jgi:hypothetical protein
LPALAEPSPASCDWQAAGELPGLRPQPASPARGLSLDELLRGAPAAATGAKESYSGGGSLGAAAAERSGAALSALPPPAPSLCALALPRALQRGRLRATAQLEGERHRVARPRGDRRAARQRRKRGAVHGARQQRFEGRRRVAQLVFQRSFAARLASLEVVAARAAVYAPARRRGPASAGRADAARRGLRQGAGRHGARVWKKN